MVDGTMSTVVTVICTSLTVSSHQWKVLANSEALFHPDSDIVLYLGSMRVVHQPQRGPHTVHVMSLKEALAVRKAFKRFLTNRKRVLVYANQ